MPIYADQIFALRLDIAIIMLHWDLPKPLIIKLFIRTIIK
jgi:hypothetical protein